MQEWIISISRGIALLYLPGEGAKEGQVPPGSGLLVNLVLAKERGIPEGFVRRALTLVQAGHGPA